MAETDITTISISAKADTKDAAAQLKALATQLERIKKVSDSGMNAANLGESLQGLANAVNSIQGLSDVKISGKLANSLAAIGDSMATLNDRIQNFDTGRLEEIRQSLQALSEIGGVGLPSTNLGGGQFPNTMATPTTVSGEEFRDAAEGEDEMSFATKTLIMQMDELLHIALGCSQALDKMGTTTRESRKSIERIGSAAKSSTSKLGQLWAAMKRIAMYRAMRTAIKMVTQAFREGIQNLYQYSSLINGTFKQSMDTLATSALYLKNSLGAMVAPIINALAPAIDMLVDKFVDLLNIFNQFLAMITGASTWTKALKYPKQYAENMERAGGAAKELRATLLGFDEINRLDDLKARGGGGGTPGMDYSKMFEEVPLIKKSLSDMWDDFLEGGKSKFALWAAGLAGILSLKLSGGLTGIFGGAAGSASLLSGFTATLLAAFAGFRLGNWLYYNVPGIKNFADDLMDAGLGKAIMNFQESVEEGWDLMIDGMIEWGDKINGFFEDVKQGWKLMHDAAIEWGDKINEKFDKIKKKATDFVDTLIEKYEKIKGTPKASEKDWQNFTNDIINAFTSAGLIFDGSQYQVKVKFLGDETEIVDWWNDHRNELGAGGFGGGGGGTTGTPGSPEMPKTGGGNSGGNVFDAIENGMKDLAKTANGIVAAIPSQSYVPAYYTKRAKGGSVETGDLFLANENGPELIAQVGNKTQVANNDQITESIRLATQQGNAEGNMLLRQAVAALNGLLAKDTTVEAVVTADSITNGLARQNLRNGRTTVAVG